MKLIIGLGNPGVQYERTRHNAGFHVVDALASKYNLPWERKNRAMIASGTIANERVVLVKPLTYMNNSGEAVGELMRWHKLTPDDLLIIYDELDLPVGRIQVRPKGSSGGHNGVSSIIRHVQTDQFPRIRIGIGRPANTRIPTADYVLSAPSGDESILLETGESKAIDAVPLILREGIGAAMNTLNIDPEAQRKAEEKRQRQLERREQERLRKEAEKAAVAQAQKEHAQAEDQATA